MPSLLLFTGPIFVAIILNWGLLGTLTVQVYTFTSLFPNERMVIKALVYVLYILDLTQTVFTTHLTWSILVSGWGDPTALTSINWTISTIPIMTGLISALVQCFYAWRIWNLKKGNRYAQGICILIVLISAMQCISAMVATFLSLIHTGYSSKVGDVTTEVEIWLAGSFICDIIIAVTMVFLLSQRKSKAFRHTETMLNKLVAHTIETGAVTAVTAGVDLVLFLIYKQEFVHLVPAIILGKLYSNAVLTTLNRRKSLQDGPPSVQQHGESHQLTWRPATSVNMLSSGQIDEQSKTVVRVDVDTDIVMDRDYKGSAV